MNAFYENSVEASLDRRGRPPRGALLRRHRAAGALDTRVSYDNLPLDLASGGEPDAEAEPYLAVDPEDSMRMLALYQEDRFPTIGGARALTFALTTDGGRNWHEGSLRRLDRRPGRVHATAMDTRTIELEAEAYEALARQKAPGQTFSDVAKSRFGRRASTFDLRKAAAELKVPEETLDAIEEQIRDRFAYRQRLMT
jgi:predicted CopG family antitoxin